MRTTKKLKILGIVLFIGYFLLMSFSIIFNWFLKDFWFFIALLFLSFYVLFKTFIFNSDSNFWLFNSLFYVGSFGIANYYLKFSPQEFYSLLSLFLPFASLLVFIVFNNWLHFYIFIHTILIIIPVLLFIFSIINIYIMIAILIVCVIILLLINLFMRRN